MVSGTVLHPETGVRSAVADRGYSFCNCRNIFYTDWSNIDHRVYDESYVTRYKSDFVDKSMGEYARIYLPKIMGEIEAKGYFIEIGSPNNTLLKRAQDVGFTPARIDLGVTPDDGIETINSDFESPALFGKVAQQIKGEISVIWTSHVFEHFRDPINALRSCFALLKEGGLLFVAMPDTFFIDMNNVYSWANWQLREHHILWDMDSFIELCEEEGFECVYKHRNLFGNFTCNGDMHLMFKKVTE